MNKIIIITQYTSITAGRDCSRFGYIAKILANHNYNVEIISTDFFHKTKKHRVLEEDIISKLGYKVTLLQEPGYKKNVSLRRFYSHGKLSKNLKKYLDKMEEKPDMIYCAIPSLDVAKVAARYAQKNNIRFIIDVQDLWPEAFKMVFHVPIISNLIFFPMKREANYIYCQADDIIAVSETYANRASMVNKKYKNKLSVYLGTDLDYFDQCKDANQIANSEDIVRLVYIGTLGHSYDIPTVIDALKILENRGITNLELLVMGDGPLKEKFESYALQNKANVIFTGRLNYANMVEKLCKCDIAINPIAKGAAQSIINKVGDYAAARTTSGKFTRM